MGLEYARQLAEIGCNLLLVSNQEKELEQAAETLKQGRDLQIIPYYQDLAAETAADELLDFCHAIGLEIDLLINNAGMFFFEELTPENEAKALTMMRLHVFTPTRLCILFGEEMKQRGYGYLINMSSMAAKLPCPGITIYSATKAYLKSFGKHDLAVMAGEDFHLSASSLRNYLNCQASFYYGAVKRLGKADEVEENLDAGMLGSVLHATMHALYSQNPDEPDEKKLRALESVSKTHIQGLLDDAKRLRARIHERIKLQLGAPEVTGRNLVYEEILVSYTRRILQRDLELLEKEGVPSFKIIGLEKYRETSLGGFRFVGYIDRLDSFAPGTLRVVDYKSGHVSDEELEITDENALKSVDALFGTDNSKRPGIALQMYLYDRMVEPERAGRELLNSVYSARRLFTEGVRNTPPSQAFASGLEPRLLETLNQMRDPQQPWMRTSDTKSCEWCDFKKICGR